MEDECDDDPFDDPFGDALHVSSGLQTTRDSSAVDDESVGGENAVKGGVALNIQCKPDDVHTAEIDVDVQTIPDNVEASLPTHRRSLGAAFDNVSVKSRWVQSHTEMINLALDPEFTFEPDEAAHITDMLDKLQRFMHNLKTHREICLLYTSPSPRD